MTLFETLTVGGGFLSTFAILIAYSQNLKNKIELLEKSDEKHEQGFSDVWAYKNSHEREASVQREMFQRELSKVESNLNAHIQVNAQQFKQMMDLLVDIKNRMEKLEDHLRRND